MSEGILWAYEEDSVDRGAKVMSEHQIRRLPIVNAEKRLVGIVALGDFAVQLSKPQGKRSPRFRNRPEPCGEPREAY